MVKEATQPSPVKPATADIHLYAVNDPIPVPEATESDSDVAWALWENSLSAQSRASDMDFTSTVPADLPLFSATPLKRNP